MDREKIIKSLLSKTVERGCTKDEASAAQTRAIDLANKWGLDLESLRRELFLEGLSRRERARLDGVDPLSELLRKYREAVKNSPEAQRARARADEKRHGASSACQHRRRKVYVHNKEAWACKDCGFFTQAWQEEKDKAYWANEHKKAGRKEPEAPSWGSKKKSSQAQRQETYKQKASKKGTGTTNPFGVHGRGTDPEGRWDSVADFVMWHLKNTDMPFEEIALQSRLKFSGKTSKNSVAWYANKIKKQGGTIPDRRK